jgi:TatD DNase family protein
MQWIDAHAHLSFENHHDRQIEEKIQRATENHIDYIINICINPNLLEHGKKLFAKHPHVLPCGSTSPHDILKDGAKDFAYFEKQAKEKTIFAIGETGLDYHYYKKTKDLQVEYLDKYLQLAEETDLPVIIHCREAFEDLFAVAKNYKGPAVLHCFTGTMKEAMQVLEKGWMISFSGIITYPNSKSLQEIAKAMPLDQIMIETDSPFLAPQSRRGKTNEPSYLIETAQMMAKLKNEELSTIAKHTYDNALSFFTRRKIA